MSSDVGSSLVFESKRLMFRSLGDDDISSRYVEWLNDSRINRYLETRFYPQTLDTCRSFVHQMNANSAQNLFGIFEKKSTKHIGNIKLGFVNVHHQTAQLSLLIGEKNCWGKGFGTEAIKRITLWGFQELGLRRIEAGCYDNNLGSLRAFLKSGYSVEGYRRKNIVYEDQIIGGFWMSILRDELE